MISSTALDLPRHREEVRLACERAGFAPHDMMEHLPALDSDAVAASLAMVERADVYVCVLAYRYGTVPAGADISITEMEYDHAVKLGKPRLIFLIHEDHEITGRDVDTVNAPKLAALKERVAKDRVAAWFKSPADLRAHVVEALHAFAKGLEEAEPEAAAKRAATELHRRTPIPAAPAPYIAHPYTLLQTRELVGRQAELNLLTDWVTKPNAADVRMFVVVAIGGMGKSAFSWKWFNQIAPNEMPGLAGRMWWSFYESDASFENFLNRALCYVSGEDEQAVRKLPWPDREAMLLRHLAEKPYLFVLDGLERILIAYNSMDASRLADDDLDQQTANRVAGAVGLPESAGQSFVGQHRLRRTIDPRAGALLQKLARAGSSRFLITARLYPSELQLPTGFPKPGCFAIFLRGLSNDDALGLWRSLGTSGSRNELLPIFNSVQNHPMLIQALAGEVANYRKAPRDFDTWRADHPQFDPTSLPLVQSRTHILDYALKGLLPEHREVLHTVVGFRMPANYSTLDALLVGDGKLFANAAALDVALNALEDRGLVGWDREANRYDAHPIVRGVVWQGVAREHKRAIMTALEQHFESIPTPDMYNVESLDDLAPAIERFNSLIELGQFNEAWLLFADRLQRPTLYRLSAHVERIAWIEKLVEASDGETEKLAEGAQINILHALAQSYGISGQVRKATDLLQEAIAKSDLYGMEKHIVDYSTLSYFLMPQGKIYQVHLFLNRIYSEFNDERWTFNRTVVLQYVARMEHIRGCDRKALIAIKRCLKISQDRGYSQLEGTASKELSRIDLQSGHLEAAKKYADMALILAENMRLPYDFVSAALIFGEIALESGDFGDASNRLNEVLTSARGVNQLEVELLALVALAKLELRQGNAAAAKTWLDQAWEGIERGPYLIIGADAFAILAETEIQLGNRAAAVAAATRAYESAWCDGPPYAYARGLKRAEALLGDLGAPFPALPPFDPENLRDFTETDINPRDEYWVDPDMIDFD